MGFQATILEDDLLGRCQQIKPALLIVPTPVDYICQEKIAT